MIWLNLVSIRHEMTYLSLAPRTVTVWCIRGLSRLSMAPMLLLLMLLVINGTG